MSVGQTLGSHSLHSFAEFLQHHIHSPEASSCLTSRRKTFTVLKPICLNIMATEKSARKGGRQRKGNTTLDLPPDLHELYKTDPQENYNQRKTESNGFEYIGQNSGSSTTSSLPNMVRRAPSSAHGAIYCTRTCGQSRSLKLLPKASTHAWSEERSQRMPTHHLCYGVAKTISSSATINLPRSSLSKTRRN